MPNIPFIDYHLYKKVLKALESGDKNPIKTYSRTSVVIPEMIKLTIAIHNGKQFVQITIDEAMVGYKLGDFVPTKKNPPQSNR